MSSISTPPLAVPQYEQELDISCLAAAARMVLAFWGIERSEAELRRLLKVKYTGANPANVCFLKDLGVEVAFYFSTLSDLRRLIGRGVPGIVFLGTQHLGYWGEEEDTMCLHSVVVVGFKDDSAVLVNDPAFAKYPISIPLAEFKRAWAFSRQLLIAIERTESP